MKMKRVLSKLLACVLACCLILAMVPGASVFAQGELQEEPLVEDQQIDKGEAWQPETRIEDISFEGDLPLEELESAQLADEDIPEIINKGAIEEKGHVNRLWEQEDGMNTIVFQNRDGTKTMYCYNYDVKYIDSDGAIRDKSNKISQTPEGDYINAENDINTIFPKNLNKDNGIELRFGEYVIEMVPDIDIDSVASLSNGSNKYGDQAEYVQYQSIFDKSVSLRYTPTYEGFKEDIVLSEYTGINEFSFRLYTDGLSLVINDEGSYFLIDPLTGETKAQIGDIIVYDSKPIDIPDKLINETVSNPTEEDYAKKESTLKELIESVPIANGTDNITQSDVKPYLHRYNVDTIEQDNEYLITAAIDMAYLNDKERIYPVYVDPSITISCDVNNKVIYDAPIYSNKPNEACGGNTYNVVGYQGSNYGIGRTLMRFPGLRSNSTYANLPTNQITNLSLHIYEGSGYTTGAYIALWQYTGGAWNESEARYSNVGWNSCSNNFTCNYINCSGWKTFNLTSMVATWKCCPSTEEQGIMIKNFTSESSSAYGKHFLSTESNYKPYLSCTYTSRTFTSLTLNQSKSGYIQQGGEYWYRFVSPQTDCYDIYSTGQTDTYCELYQSTFLESDDNDGEGNNFKISIKLYEGVEYCLKVKGKSLLTSGSYSLKIESVFLNNLQELHNIAKAYTSNYADAVNLTMQFIRRLKYNGSYSNWDKWGLAAGNIDYSFANYVYSINPQLYDYFSINSGEDYYFICSTQLDKVDIPHLCATYNVHYYNTFGLLGEITILEELVDCLGGWGGDLRSMIPEVIKVASDPYSYTSVYNTAYALIGNSISFSMPDLFADIDAYNLYNNPINLYSLKTTFENYYYNGGINSRFTDFKTGISYSDMREMANDICDTSGIVNTVWPIFQLDNNNHPTNIQIALSTTQIDAIATAFTDYIWDKAQQE